jgi:hypothetical protein
MSLIAIIGIVLGLFAANREDWDSVAVFLLASLVIVVPVHFAIEGNRRDAVNAEVHRECGSNQEGSTRPVQRSRPGGPGRRRFSAPFANDDSGPRSSRAR